MKRRLWFIFCTLSQLLAVAAAGLWVYSYQGGKRVTYHHAAAHSRTYDVTRHDLMMYRGGFQLRFDEMRNVDMVENDTMSRPQGWRVDAGFRVTQGYPAMRTGQTYFGFGFTQKQNVILVGSPVGGPTSSGWSLECIVPIWSLCLLFGIAPAAWLWRYRSARRREQLGLCRTCGYDLRATLDRCPECGAEPSVQTAQPDRATPRQRARYH